MFRIYHGVCVCKRYFLTNNSVRNNKGLCSYVKYISVVTVPLLLVPCFFISDFNNALVLLFVICPCL